MANVIASGQNANNPPPLSIENPGDWKTLFENAYNNNKYNKFVNYRFSPSTVSSSFSGCVGTDEEGKPIIQPAEGATCDLNNITNSRPCRIDTNLHTPDTCKLNASIFDSKKKFMALNSGASIYSPGLYYTVYGGSMRDNYDNFFINNPPAYFSDVSTEFDNLGAETRNTIIENQGHNGSWKGDGTSSHWFTIEWRGFFKAPQPGTYRISMESDDSSILWLDDAANDPHFYGPSRNVILDNAGGHGMITKTYDYKVLDTNYHPVRIRFEEGYGGYGCIIKVYDLQNGNTDIANSCFFHYSQSNMSTYYSLVRNSTNSNLYDCYLTNQDGTVEKSKGKQYLYRTLNQFTGTFPAKPTNYLAVGDDGTLQIYEAKKNIDFNGNEPRDGTHPEFVARLNGPFDETDISYWLNWDGNLNGDSNGVNKFLSWQDWLKFPRDGSWGNKNIPVVKLWFQLNNPGDLDEKDKPKEYRADGVFNMYASPDNYAYWPGWNLKKRNIIVHKDNPFNTTGKHYSLVGAKNNYKFRMDSQGQLKIIYAVPACESVINNGEKVNYSPDQTAFAFYNVNGDPRMNQSFYYDQSDNTLSYIDKSVYKNLYVKHPDGSSQDYTEYKNIYIPEKIKLDKNEIKQSIDKPQCETICNSNPDCRYFYWGKNQANNGNDLCYVDSKKYPYEFTPSSEPEGSTMENIGKYPFSLFVKEQTIMVNPQLVGDPNPMVTETDYAKKYNTTSLPIINYRSAEFKQKFDPANTKSYVDDTMKDVRNAEVEYYFPSDDIKFMPGYNAKTLQNSRNIPAGSMGIENKETFMGYYGKEGLGNADTGADTGSDAHAGLTQTDTTADSNDGPQKKIGTGYVSPTGPSYSPSNTDGNTRGAEVYKKWIESLNTNKWVDFMPPPATMVIQRNDIPNVAFYNLVYEMMKHVYIHLPLYKLEAGTLFPSGFGCYNRGFGKTNFNSVDGSCTDKYHIIKTAYEYATHHNATYYGDNTVQQNNSKMPYNDLPFCDRCLNFTGEKVAYGYPPSTTDGSQYLQIIEPINWPYNALKFSFYFKVNGNTPQWARIFDFSNGQFQDNIFVYVAKVGAGLGLGFQCKGTNVYGENEPIVSSDPGVMFENIQDKWHFCQWGIFKDYKLPNPIPGNPNTEGVKIWWLILLHTLENDGSVTVRHVILWDTTFSNYRNQKEKDNYPDRIKYITDSRPFKYVNCTGHQDPEAFIAADPNDTRAFIPTRAYVGGYDCLCIGSKLVESSNGSIWDWPCINAGVTTLKPVWLTTPRFRLSFPTKPTTQNFINASPWGDPSIIGSIRDFKVVFDEWNMGTEAAFPSSFSWCVDTIFTKIGLRKELSNEQINKFQLWKYQPIVTDNGSGVFSDCKLIKDFMSPKLSANNPGWDLSKISRYDPEITNNIANFIYSQIIYYKQPEMLRLYLQTMQTEGFQNIEGFSLSPSLREGLTDQEMKNRGYDVLPNDNKLVPALYNNANLLISNNSYYKTRLGKISQNTKELKQNLDDYHSSDVNIKNAKNDMYDMSGNHLLYYQNKDIPSLRDSKITDNQQFIIQQNSIYIIGTITCASMILAAIILARQ